MIRFVPKESLFPAFGFCYPSQNIVIVRDDLPKIVQTFVLAHENYHLKDKTQFWLWREIRANWHAGLRHPIGFAATAALSLAPARLWYYSLRFLGLAR